MSCGNDHGKADSRRSTMTCCDAQAGPHPSPLLMALRFAAFVAGVLTALWGMVKERKFKHLAVWLGGWALFLTWPRYLICSRCEGYGNMCYSYYIGKYTSMLFPRVEGKEPGNLGLVQEVVSLSTIFWTPALALRGNRKLLARYLATMNAVLLGQFLHACRYCAANSTQEWKNVCPAHRTWKKILKLS